MGCQGTQTHYHIVHSVCATPPTLAHCDVVALTKLEIARTQPGTPDNCKYYHHKKNTSLQLSILSTV